MNLFYARDWHPGWRGAADYEDKQNCQNDSFESPRGMTIINEFGLYSLILRSQLPKAHQFKRWVTSEVLPAIHKHGVFAVDTMDGVAICDSMGREQETILIKETGFAR